MKFALSITFALASAVWATPTTGNFNLLWASQTRTHIFSKPTTTTARARPTSRTFQTSDRREICVGRISRPQSDPAVCARARQRHRGALSRVAKRKTVLVVDDEPAVRRLIRAILLRQGYEVLEAEDGLVAYELLERLSGGIHLLITDVEMPRMDGIALGQKVGADYPSIEVLYMSGFISDAPKRHFPSHRFLPKPFAPNVLVQWLRSLGA